MTTKAKAPAVLDTTSPTYVKIIPTNNTTSVAPTSNLSITFSEKIKTGTGNITLINNNGNDSRIIPITDKQIKISGNKLTLNPTVDLNIDDTYKVHFDAGVIKDLASIANLTSAIDFTFTTKSTKDKQAPILQNNTFNGDLKLTFQENIKIGKGSFTLSDGINKVIIPVNDSQVSVSNNVLTIHTQNLNPEKTYTLLAPKGIVTDMVGNKFKGITTKTPFKFDTHDSTAPLLVSTSPSDDSTNVAVSESIVLTFNEDVTPGSGNFVIGNGTDTRSIPVNNSQITISGKTVTIKQTTDLLPNTNYSVKFASGVIADKVGNLFSGVNDDTTLNFKTVDSSDVSLLYSGTSFTEASVNDGSIDTVITLTLSGDKFAGATNTPLSGVSITNIPTGLTAVITKISDTVATLSLTGKATAHSNVNDIHNLTVSLSDASFTNAKAITVTGATTNNFTIDFADQLVQSVDTVAPTVILTSNVDNITSDETAIISAIFSEQPKGFAIDDFVSTNGRFSNFSVIDNTHYTVVFTPNVSNTTDSNITITAGSYTDAAGNLGIAGIKPLLTITPSEYSITTNANGTQTETYNFNQDGHKIISVYNYDTTNTLISSTEQDTWADHSSQTNYSLILNSDGTKSEIYTFNNDGVITSTQYEEITQTKTSPFNAGVADVNFTIVESNSSYAFNITNFGTGDSLVFSNSVITPIISNVNTTDNAVDIIYANGNVTTTLQLTGISQDTRITDYDSFLQVFTL